MKVARRSTWGAKRQPKSGRFIIKIRLTVAVCLLIVRLQTTNNRQQQLLLVVLFRADLFHASLQYLEAQVNLRLCVQLSA